MQIFWVPKGLSSTPLPIRTSHGLPAAANKKVQLSKSQSSLLTVSGCKKKEEKNVSKQLNDDIRTYSNSNNNMQVAKIQESPSYADYENYFYI